MRRYFGEKSEYSPYYNDRAGNRYGRDQGPPIRPQSPFFNERNTNFHSDHQRTGYRPGLGFDGGRDRMSAGPYGQNLTPQLRGNSPIHERHFPRPTYQSPVPTYLPRPLPLFRGQPPPLQGLPGSSGPFGQPSGRQHVTGPHNNHRRGQNVTGLHDEHGRDQTATWHSPSPASTSCLLSNSPNRVLTGTFGDDNPLIPGDSFRLNQRIGSSSPPLDPTYLNNSIQIQSQFGDADRFCVRTSEKPDIDTMETPGSIERPSQNSAVSVPDSCKISTDPVSNDYDASKSDTCRTVVNETDVQKDAQMSNSNPGRDPVSSGSLEDRTGSANFAIDKSAEWLIKECRIETATKVSESDKNFATCDAIGKSSRVHSVHIEEDFLEMDAVNISDTESEKSENERQLGLQHTLPGPANDVIEPQKGENQGHLQEIMGDSLKESKTVPKESKTMSNPDKESEIKTHEGESQDSDRDTLDSFIMSFVCGMCNVEYQSTEELEDHLKTAHANMPDSGKIVDVESSDKESWICKMCNVSFDNDGDLVSHVLSHETRADKQSHDASDCGSSSPKKKPMLETKTEKSRERRCTGRKALEMDAVKISNIEAEESENERGLHDTMADPANDIEPQEGRSQGHLQEIINDSSKGSKTVSKEIEIVDDPVSETEMESNEGETHDSDIDTSDGFIMSYVCGVCNIEYQSTEELEDHLKTAHMTVPDSEKVADGNGSDNESWVCKICNVSFDSDSNLVNHVMSHATRSDKESLEDCDVTSRKTDGKLDTKAKKSKERRRAVRKEPDEQASITLEMECTESAPDMVMQSETEDDSGLKDKQSTVKHSRRSAEYRTAKRGRHQTTHRKSGTDLSEDVQSEAIDRNTTPRKRTRGHFQAIDLCESPSKKKHIKSDDEMIQKFSLSPSKVRIQKISIDDVHKADLKGANTSSTVKSLQNELTSGTQKSSAEISKNMRKNETIAKARVKIVSGLDATVRNKRSNVAKKHTGKISKESSIQKNQTNAKARVEDLSTLGATVRNRPTNVAKKHTGKISNKSSIQKNQTNAKARVEDLSSSDTTVRNRQTNVAKKHTGKISEKSRIEKNQTNAKARVEDLYSSDTTVRNRQTNVAKKHTGKISEKSRIEKNQTNAKVRVEHLSVRNKQTNVAKKHTGKINTKSTTSIENNQTDKSNDDKETSVTNKDKSQISDTVSNSSRNPKKSNAKKMSRSIDPEGDLEIIEDAVDVIDLDDFEENKISKKDAELMKKYGVKDISVTLDPVRYNKVKLAAIEDHSFKSNEADAIASSVKSDSYAVDKRNIEVNRKRKQITEKKLERKTSSQKQTSPQKLGRKTSAQKQISPQNKMQRKTSPQKRTSQQIFTNASAKSLDNLSSVEMETLLKECGMGITVPTPGLKSSGIEEAMETSPKDKHTSTGLKRKQRSFSPQPSTSNESKAKRRRIVKDDSPVKELVLKHNIKESNVCVKRLSIADIERHKNPQSPFGKSDWLNHKFDSDNDDDEIEWDFPTPKKSFEQSNDLRKSGKSVSQKRTPKNIKISHSKVNPNYSDVNYLSEKNSNSASKLKQYNLKELKVVLKPVQDCSMSTNMPNSKELIRARASRSRRVSECTLAKYDLSLLKPADEEHRHVNINKEIGLNERKRPHSSCGKNSGNTVKPIDPDKKKHGKAIKSVDNDPKSVKSTGKRHTECLNLSQKDETTRQCKNSKSPSQVKRRLSCSVALEDERKMKQCNISKSKDKHEECHDISAEFIHGGRNLRRSQSSLCQNDKNKNGKIDSRKKVEDNSAKPIQGKKKQCVDVETSGHSEKSTTEKRRYSRSKIDHMGKEIDVIKVGDKSKDLENLKSSPRSADKKGAKTTHTLQKCCDHNCQQSTSPVRKRRSKDVNSEVEKGDKINSSSVANTMNSKGRSQRNSCNTAKQNKRSSTSTCQNETEELDSDSDVILVDESVECSSKKRKRNTPGSPKHSTPKSLSSPASKSKANKNRNNAEKHSSVSEVIEIDDDDTKEDGKGDTGRNTGNRRLRNNAQDKLRTSEYNEKRKSGSVANKTLMCEKTKHKGSKQKNTEMPGIVEIVDSPVKDRKRNTANTTLVCEKTKQKSSKQRNIVPEVVEIVDSPVKDRKRNTRDQDKNSCEKKLKEKSVSASQEQANRCGKVKHSSSSSCKVLFGIDSDKLIANVCTKQVKIELTDIAKESNGSSNLGLLIKKENVPKETGSMLIEADEKDSLQTRTRSVELDGNSVKTSEVNAVFKNGDNNDLQTSELVEKLDIKTVGGDTELSNNTLHEDKEISGEADSKGVEIFSKLADDDRQIPSKIASDNTEIADKTFDEGKEISGKAIDEDKQISDKSSDEDKEISSKVVDKETNLSSKPSDEDTETACKVVEEDTNISDKPSDEDKEISSKTVDNDTKISNKPSDKEMSSKVVEEDTKISDKPSDEDKDISSKTVDEDKQISDKPSDEEISSKVVDKERNISDKPSDEDKEISSKTVDDDKQVSDKPSDEEMSCKAVDKETNVSDKSSDEEMSCKAVDKETNVSDKPSDEEMSCKAVDKETNVSDKSSDEEMSCKAVDKETNVSDKPSDEDEEISSKTADEDKPICDQPSDEEISSKVVEENTKISDKPSDEDIELSDKPSDEDKQISDKPSDEDKELSSKVVEDDTKISEIPSDEGKEMSNKTVDVDKQISDKPSDEDKEISSKVVEEDTKISDKSSDEDMEISSKVVEIDTKISDKPFDEDEEISSKTVDEDPKVSDKPSDEDEEISSKTVDEDPKGSDKPSDEDEEISSKTVDEDKPISDKPSDEEMSSKMVEEDTKISDEPSDEDEEISSKTVDENKRISDLPSHEEGSSKVVEKDTKISDKSSDEDLELCNKTLDENAEISNKTVDDTRTSNETVNDDRKISSDIVDDDRTNEIVEKVTELSSNIVAENADTSN